MMPQTADTTNRDDPLNISGRYPICPMRTVCHSCIIRSAVWSLDSLTTHASVAVETRRTDLRFP